jgi:hypothetical protein
MQSITTISSLATSCSSDNKQSFGWEENGVFKKIAKQFQDYVTENEIFIGSHISHPNLVQFKGTETKYLWLEENKDEVCSDEYIPGETIPVKVTLWEYLDGITLSSMIEDEKYSNKQVINCIKQVIFTILELQEKYSFVHGDLHGSNIFICKTNEKVLNYSINGSNFQVETLGFVSKVFDFGNSDLWSQPYVPHFLTTPLYATYEGYINIFNDIFFDLRVFMCRVKNELFDNRHGDFVLKFMRLFRNLFYSFGVEAEFKPEINFYNELGEVIDQVNDKLPLKSQITKECNDLLCGLIQVPLNVNQSSENIEVLLNNFWDEKNGLIVKFLTYWTEIEKYFTPRQATFVLKQLINFCKKNYNKSGDLIEGEFASFVATQFSNFNINNIFIEHRTCAILFNSIMMLITSLTYFASTLYKEFGKVLMLNQEISENMFKVENIKGDNDNNIVSKGRFIFAKIINIWE